MRIRDVLQNHLLQVVTLLAMEPPVGPDASFLQDEKAKVLAAMEPIDPRCSCAVSTSAIATSPASTPDSTVETFVAARLEIDSWRWAGVPWYVRCGKALAARRHRGGRRVPRTAAACCSTRPAAHPDRNLVRFRLGKNDGVTFTLQAKTPGPHLDSQSVDVAVDFAAALGERHDAYERLLGDAMDGSPRRFAR